MKYPDTYLFVEESRSGETWIMPIRANEHLDLKKLIKKWIKKHFCSELVLDGEIMPRWQGEYYARIMTDGRPPESAICWTSGGFYIKEPW